MFPNKRPTMMRMANVKRKKEEKKKKKRKKVKLKLVVQPNTENQ